MKRGEESAPNGDVSQDGLEEVEDPGDRERRAEYGPEPAMERVESALAQDRADKVRFAGRGRRRKEGREKSPAHQ